MPSNVPSIVFLGAGSVVFTRDLLTDVLSTAELADARIVLYDIDADRLATARRVAGWIADAFGAKPVIVATDDRREALSGADFVVNSIQVGMHAATVRDFEIPARYGLRQTIADTTGVGGIFRGLRTFPVLAGIAADMLAICPDAWLLNYTNPMAMNVGYLRAIAPRLKVVGLCHSVYWTVRGLCELIDVPFESVDYRTAGMNHQAWLLRFEHRGESLYPAAGRPGPVSVAGSPDRGGRAAAAAGPGGHVPAARLLPDRDQRTLVRVRGVVPAARHRGRAAAHCGR